MRTLIAAIILAIITPASAQTLEKQTIRNARNLTRTLRLEAEFMSKQDLRKVNELIDQAMDVVDGIASVEMTCTHTWHWNGPDVGDMGPHNFYGTGSDKDKAYNNLVANCIASDIHLTTDYMCRGSIKKEQVFCYEE